MDFGTWMLASEAAVTFAGLLLVIFWEYGE